MINLFFTDPVIWGLSAATGVAAAVVAYRSVGLALLLRWVFLRVLVAVVVAVGVVGAGGFMMIWIRDHPDAMVCACTVPLSGKDGPYHG